MGRAREAGLFPTKEDVHGIKRLEVLRQAAASFNFKGYHATSMNEIAASVGVTKAALYHYFPNKNSLLAACFEHAMEAAFASLERGRGQGKNGCERLVLTICGYVEQLIDELNCCVVLMEEQALEPEDHAKLVRQRDRFERALRALVKEGIADGSVVPCDPKLAVFVILGAMNWVPKWFKPSGAWKSDQLTVAIGQMFERIISSSPSVALPRDVADLPTRVTSESAGLMSLVRRARTQRTGLEKKFKAGRKVMSAESRSVVCRLPSRFLP
jgi:TetR/AcrR family transcriptional regulator